MTNPQLSGNISEPNQRSLKTLARAIAFSKGRFSLILVWCNYASLRSQILQQLQEQSTVKLRSLVLPESAKALYPMILAEVGDQPSEALMVLGLESVVALEELIASANRARDKFKSSFAFPVVLWGTDAVIRKLGRLAPDFNSWAGTPIKFSLTDQELIDWLRQKSEQVFTSNSTFTLNSSEPEAAQQELQSRGQKLEPELEASWEFILGLLHHRNQQIDTALEYYQQSLAFWQRANQLERQGRVLLRIAAAYSLQGKQHQADQKHCLQQTREHLQHSLAAFEQGQHLDLVAQHINQLGEVLRDLKEWESLQTLANKALMIHQNYGEPRQLAQDYGFLAQVALEQSRWSEAQQHAQQALELSQETSSADLQAQGLYHFLLAQSLGHLGQVQPAIDHLETARNQSQPQYYPQLYTGILEQLRLLYFEQHQYLKAFNLKLEQREIKSQYGLQAFIGAGRLQPQRQVIGTQDESPLPQQPEMIQDIVAASGRQQDVKRLIKRIGQTNYKLTVVYGQSGVGKSSILEAGLVPTLEVTPFERVRDTLPLLVRTYTNWVEDLNQQLSSRGVQPSDSTDTALCDVMRYSKKNPPKSPLERGTFIAPLSKGGWGDKDVPHNSENCCNANLTGVLAQLRQNSESNLLTVLIFDQFEEFFFTRQDQASKQAFYQFLRDCVEIPFVNVILSLREDYLHYFFEFTRTTELKIIDGDDRKILEILYYLGNFSPQDAKSVFQTLTERAKFHLEPALVDQLVQDLAGELGEIRPIELQIVGAQLQAKGITQLKEYQKHGTKTKLVERFLDEVIIDCGRENERVAQSVLYLLTDEKNTRPLKTKEDLAKDLEPESHKLDLVLEILIKSGVVLQIPGHPTAHYQLVHDYLVPFIRHKKGSDLLAELAREKEQRRQSEKKLNKILQWALFGSVIAVIAMTALWSRSSRLAKESAVAKTKATAEKLIAQSKQLQDEQPNQRPTAALLAVEAFNRLQSINQPTVEAQSNLQRSILQLPKFIHWIDDVSLYDFSPNSQYLAIGSSSGTVKVVEIETQDLVLTISHDKSVGEVIFSENGKYLATFGGDNKVNLANINSGKTTYNSN
ncbi:MAG: tetratricopeptide repeat protein, partial [Symploca sp. SIO2E6]|nr:tetratricopeptide repeat protein [Symploca sp. SIO2E6]